MKLFLDTTAKDFALALFDNNLKLINKIIISNQPKKIDLITEYVPKICTDSNVNIHEIDTFYTNLGPGLFTGVRISLVYLRTIALITNAKIKTVSSMQILQRQNPLQREFNINAMGNKYFNYFALNTHFSVDLVKVVQGELINYDQIDYEELFNNFAVYEDLFIENNEPINIEPYYIKQPQIGSKK